MEKVESLNNPNETVRKYGAASWITGVYCMDNGDLGIRFRKDLTSEDPVSFMLTTNQGNLLKESADVPFIKFNEHHTDTVYSPDMQAEAPNTLIKWVLIRN